MDQSPPTNGGGKLKNQKREKVLSKEYCAKKIKLTCLLVPLRDFPKQEKWVHQGKTESTEKQSP